MKQFNKHNKDGFSLDSIKESGFKTPNNFFNTVEDDFFIKFTEKELPNKNGFTTPDNYFDSLENKITSKINNKTKVISLRNRIIKMIPYAAAASILLFIGINYFTMQNETITFDNLTQDDLENWYATNDTNLTNLELAEVINFTDEDDTLLSYNNLNDNEIEEYIYTIDTSTFINEIE